MHDKIVLEMLGFIEGCFRSKSPRDFSDGGGGGDVGSFLRLEEECFLLHAHE